MEQPLSSPLHLVPEMAHVLQGDLGLGGQAASPVQGQRLRRLEPDLLPFQGAGRLLRWYRPQMHRQVHGRSGSHQPLQEARGQAAGPLAQVQGAGQVAADADVAAVDLHLQRGFLVPLVGGAAQGRGQQQQLERIAGKGEHPQAGADQQRPELVGAAVLAHGVEPPVQDALPGFQGGQQPSQAVGGVAGLLRQVFGLGLGQGCPQGLQDRRVLAHQQLHRKVQGVEGTGEGPQLGFVQLQPHHLEHR